MNTTLLRGLRPASLRSRIPFNSSKAAASMLQYMRLASSTAASSPSSRSAKRIPSRAPSYNGSSKATAASTSKPTTSTTTTILSSTSPLNGPPTTHPAPLSLPTRAPNQPFFFKYAFTLGKAYAIFYKSGVKNIWTNYNASRPVQDRIDKNHNFSLPAAVAANALTRSEFQLLTRNWHDTKRVPLFGLVFVVCGEFTPLVVIALSSVVPWTCRIPRQIESDRSKLEKRRAISFRNLTAPLPTATDSSVSIVSELNRQQLIHISWSLGLSSSIWDYLGGQYPGLPNFLLRRKVDRTVKYLEMDDSLIKASGVPLSSMDIEEVRMALVERGVDVLGASEGKLRGNLSAWMKSRERVGVETLLLTRPRAWPVQPLAAKL